MENENIVTVQFKFTRNKALLLTALCFLCWQPKTLSSETLTLTTYYPAPYGGYVSLLTTGGGNTNTLLTRDGGNVLVGMTTEAAPATQKLDVNGSFRASGEVTSTLGAGFGQFRAISGNYGAFIRNDGTDTYMPLFTNSGNQYGTFNGLRPLRVSNSTGDVFLAGGQAIFRHGTGVLDGLCRTVTYNVSGTATTCNANERVMAAYSANGAAGRCLQGLVFLGGDLNTNSAWAPHYAEGCAGTMICCRVAAP